MSSVPSLSLPPALPLDIILFISGVKYLLNEIIVSAAWLGVMVPLFCVLFAASSPALRRKPIFIFNAISVSTGIIMGITNVVFLVSCQLYCQNVFLNTHRQEFLKTLSMASAGGLLYFMSPWWYRWRCSLTVFCFSEFIACFRYELPESMSYFGSMGHFYF